MILGLVLSIVPVLGFIPHSIQPIRPTTTMTRTTNPSVVSLLHRPLIIEPDALATVQPNLSDFFWNCFCCTEMNHPISCCAVFAAAAVVITIFILMFLFLWKSHLVTQY